MAVLWVPHPCGRPVALGDELHLSQGVLEGSVKSESKLDLKLQTPSGLLAVPKGLVIRHVHGPSRLERYALERKRVPLTPARHLELAHWCRANHLTVRGRQHVASALDLAPGNAEARRLSGYVQVGEVWLFAGTPTDNDQDARRAAGQALVDQLVIGWHRRLRTLLENHLASPVDPQTFAAGRDQLLAIQTPLLLRPACRILGAGEVPARQVLAELLGSLGTDAATLNLVAMTLLDPSRGVRESAANELARLADRRVQRFLQEALHCSLETLVTRAAQTLGWLRDPAAVKELVAVLPVSGPSGPRIESAKLLAKLPVVFPVPTLVPISDEPVEVACANEFDDLRRTLEVLAAEDRPASGLFRSAVQDALIAITGENYGFDVAAWRDWLAKHPPIDTGYP